MRPHTPVPFLPSLSVTHLRLYTRLSPFTSSDEKLVKLKTIKNPLGQKAEKVEKAEVVKALLLDTRKVWMNWKPQ